MTPDNPSTASTGQTPPLSEAQRMELLRIAREWLRAQVMDMGDCEDQLAQSLADAFAKSQLSRQPDAADDRLTKLCHQIIANRAQAVFRGLVHPPLDYEKAAQLADGYLSQARALSEREAEVAQARTYLEQLFKACAPQCKPLPDLLGLCTQIDNLIAGYRIKLGELTIGGVSIPEVSLVDLRTTIAE